MTYQFIWVINLVIITKVGLEVQNGHRASQKLENGILLSGTAVSWTSVPNVLIEILKDIVQVLTKGI